MSKQEVVRGSFVRNFQWVSLLRPLSLSLSVGQKKKKVPMRKARGKISASKELIDKTGDMLVGSRYGSWRPMAAMGPSTSGL